MCKNMLNRGKTEEQDPTEQKNDRLSHRRRGNAQSIADRRHLRAQYRAVKVHIAERKFDSDGFNHVFGNMEDLYNEVSQPREQIADAEALFDISTSLLASVKEFKTRQGPTASELVTSIARNFAANVAPPDDRIDSALDWERLGHEACAIFSDAPGLTTMMGPMDSRPKQRKIPSRRPRDRPVETAHPEELRESNDNETLTDKNMETMFKILKRFKSVYLEELVLNRRSFAQTVENVFALSFLVKDGRAEIAVKDGRQVVGPMNFPSQHQRELGRGSMKQFVFRFDFNDWRGMKGIVAEGRELMPDREDCCRRPNGRVKIEQ